MQQEILLIKRKIRDLLHMPETPDDPDAAADDPLGKMAKELETMMSDYFRRTVHKQDIQKNIEVCDWETDSVICLPLAFCLFL